MTPLYRNRVSFAIVQSAAGNNQQQEQALTNADNVTSTAVIVTEVPGAIKTTNIDFAMNHVNDQENLKQLSLAPVQVNKVEKMDIQEGKYTSLSISKILLYIYIFIYILSF